jgi:hypothetical protein
MWNPFDRRTPREKALSEIAKRLGMIEEIVEGDAEDSDIAAVMHRLGQIEHRLMEEQEPTPTGNNTLGDVAVGILSELIPSQFRGMAQGPIKEFFRNPANVELAKVKLQELAQVLNKGQQQQPQPQAPPQPTNQQGQLPQIANNQDPRFFQQSYRPGQGQ